MNLKKQYKDAFNRQSISPIGIIQHKNGIQDVLAMKGHQPKKNDVHNMTVGKLNVKQLCKRLHISRHEFRYYFNDLVRRGLLVDLSSETRGDARR